MYKVEIRSEPERRVVGLGHSGAYDQIGGVFRQFSAMLSAQGLWPRVIAFLGVYLDDPSDVPVEDLHSMAAAQVSEDLPLPEGMRQMRLAGGRHVVLTLVGPYQGLPAAYEWLYASWLPESGEVPRDAPVLEIYVNDPREVAEEALVTEICVPVV